MTKIFERRVRDGTGACGDCMLPRDRRRYITNNM